MQDLAFFKSSDLRLLEMEQVEHVESSVDAPSRTVKVWFTKGKKSANAKAPIARCLVQIDGTLKGLVIDMPIFRGKDGNGISVSYPGGGFPAIRPMPIIANGFETTTPEPTAVDLADKLPELVGTAYHVWLTTGKAEQAITLP
jgi:hypothetical protein